MALSYTPRGWPYLTESNLVSETDDYSAELANKLETGQADVAAAANYAAEAKAAAYGPAIRLAIQTTTIPPNSSAAIDLVGVGQQSYYIPRTGLYGIAVNVTILAGDGVRSLDIVVDGGASSPASDSRPGVTSTSVSYSLAAAPIRLDEGQRVGLRLWHSSGSPCTVHGGWLGVYWIAGVL